MLRRNDKKRSARLEALAEQFRTEAFVTSFQLEEDAQKKPKKVFERKTFRRDERNTLSFAVS